MYVCIFIQYIHITVSKHIHNIHILDIKGHDIHILGLQEMELHAVFILQRENSNMGLSCFLKFVANYWLY